MNENVLVLLHEYLCRTAEVNTMQELEDIADEYAHKLDVCNEKLSEAVWKDIKNIGSNLVSLRIKDNADNRSKQLSALTEQEQSELIEAEKVIDDNLFDYHFQPIVSAVDGSIYSYEALMRPRSTLCPSPFHIMKYAELTKRFDDIERLTFFNILSIIENEKDKFNGKRVFINSIPKTKFAEKDYIHISRLLEKHSDTVVVEMTEKSELRDDELNEIKEQYQRMNVKIAVDDYGTGYSNVQNLLRYMPDYVKIDRSLLTEIQNNSKKRHFVREIVEFCHDNDILALAEGVETAEELRTVILLGIDLIQGYYTARPNAEIVGSIPYEIKQEIKRCRQEREEGKKLHIYAANKSERIQLDRLVKDKYSCILVGKNGNGDVTISGLPGKNSKVHIDVVNDFKGSITLENATLSIRKNRPCIDIGENCDVQLILIGSNYMQKGGIRVPESSRLTVSGEGRLSITVDGLECYGIGNDPKSAHGELVFEQDVAIENNAACGIGIGSGLGGKIRILRGRYTLDMTSAYGVGIGALDADTDLDLFACDISINCSMLTGTGIGSMNGNCHAYIHNASTKLYLSGDHIAGIGTISGKRSDVEISEASAVINVLTDNGSAIGSVEGDTYFKQSRANLHITAEGNNALAFGGFDGNIKVELVDSDTTVKIVGSTKHADFIRNQKPDISGGRIRFALNDEEIEIPVL